MDRIEAELVVGVKSRGSSSNLLRLRTGVRSVVKSEAPIAVRSGRSQWRAFDDALWQPMNPNRPVLAKDLSPQRLGPWTHLRDDAREVQKFVLPAHVHASKGWSRLVDVSEVYDSSFQAALEVDGIMPLDDRLILIDGEAWQRSQGPLVELVPKQGYALDASARDYWLGDILHNALYVSALDREAVEDALRDAGIVPAQDWPEVVEPALLTGEGVSQAMAESALWVVACYAWSTFHRREAYESEEIAALILCREALAELWPTAGEVEILDKAMAIIRIVNAHRTDLEVLMPAVRAIAELEQPRNRQAAKTAGIIGPLMTRRVEAEQDFSAIDGLRV